MSLRYIMLNERSQKLEVDYYMILFTQSSCKGKTRRDRKKTRDCRRLDFITRHLAGRITTQNLAGE